MYFIIFVNWRIEQSCYFSRSLSSAEEGPKLGNLLSVVI